MFCFINLTEYVDAIQKVVDSFVETELSIYLSTSGNEDFTRSVVANIAMFDMAGINTETGFIQMGRLLGDHYDQMVERRLRQLLHKLYIKYGDRIINRVSRRVVKTMSLAYPQTHVENIMALNKKHNTFWLIPFIKDAYNTVMITNRK